MKRLSAIAAILLSLVFMSSCGNEVGSGIVPDEPEVVEPEDPDEGKACPLTEEGEELLRIGTSCADPRAFFNENMDKLRSLPHVDNVIFDDESCLLLFDNGTKLHCIYDDRSAFDMGYAQTSNVKKEKVETKAVQYSDFNEADVIIFNLFAGDDTRKLSNAIVDHTVEMLIANRYKVAIAPLTYLNLLDAFKSENCRFIYIITHGNVVISGTIDSLSEYGDPGRYIALEYGSTPYPYYEMYADGKRYSCLDLHEFTGEVAEETPKIVYLASCCSSLGKKKFKDNGRHAYIGFDGKTRLSQGFGYIICDYLFHFGISIKGMFKDLSNIFGTVKEDIWDMGTSPELEYFGNKDLLQLPYGGWWDNGFKWRYKNPKYMPDEIKCRAVVRSPEYVSIFTEDLIKNDDIKIKALVYTDEDQDPRASINVKVLGENTGDNYLYDNHYEPFLPGALHTYIGKLTIPFEHTGLAIVDVNVDNSLLGLAWYDSALPVSRSYFFMLPFWPWHNMRPNSGEIDPLSISVSEIDFGDVPLGTSATRSITFSNMSNYTIAAGYSKLTEPFSTDDSDNIFYLEPKESKTVEITFTPTSNQEVSHSMKVACDEWEEARTITIIANGGKAGEQDPNVEYVDLGLSVKWATCNLGATKPEEPGLYYQWGDTQGYGSDTSDDKYFYWSDENGNVTYKWCNGSYNSLTKYNTDSSFGTVDNKRVLDMEDDAARAALGGNWRMPTEAEWTELRENCTWTWTKDYNGTGVAGRIVTSNKTGYTDKSIFLPAAGCRSGDGLGYAGSGGNYWSSSLFTDYPTYAWYVDFHTDYVYRGSDYRYNGLSVRPVSE